MSNFFNLGVFTSACPAPFDTHGEQLVLLMLAILGRSLDRV